jgi:hypothetical protein
VRTCPNPTGTATSGNQKGVAPLEGVLASSFA